MGVVVRGAGRSLGALLERCSDSAREQRLPLTLALPHTPSRAAAGTSCSWPCQHHMLWITWCGAEALDHEVAGKVTCRV